MVKNEEINKLASSTTSIRKTVTHIITMKTLRKDTYLGK